MKVWGHILDALERHGRGALVSVLATQGSAPRDQGAHMVVTPEGYHGTIGGGALEWRAIAMAQAMLANGAGARITSHALGPELGQCCGGRVDLVTEVFDRTSTAPVRQWAKQESAGRFVMAREVAGRTVEDAFGEARRCIYLFGAGHVGRALVLALAPLPFDVVWIDQRASAFPKAMPQNVTAVAPEDPVSSLADAPKGSLVFIMTHSHGLDLAITDAALRNSNVAHTGLIGSATKRARFAKRLREAAVAEDRIAALGCPIGAAGIRSKEPAMIALATAAQIAMIHETLAQREKTGQPAEHPLTARGMT